MFKKALIVFAGAMLAIGVGSGVCAQEKTLGQRHGAMWPQSQNGYVTKAQCQQCHKYDQLAAKTAKMEPNPHFSHLGEVNCEDCHKVDQAKPELMCNQCHQFTIRQKAQPAQ